MRLYIVIIFGLILFAHCNKPQVEPDSLLLIGHGGEGFSDQNTLYAPNSVGSIRRALDFYDLDGVEVDVQFTLDEDLIVYHDDFLENATQCKGKVAGKMLSEINGCHFKKQYYNKYDQQVIFIDSLITLINDEYPDKLFTLNVRIDGDRLKLADSLAMRLDSKLKKIDNLRNVSTECADANFLFYLKRINPEYTCYLVADLKESHVYDVERFGLDGLVSFFETRHERLEERLHRNLKKVFLYGQKNSSHYTCYSYDYITGVQVDNPILARKFFNNE